MSKQIRWTEQLAVTTGALVNAVEEMQRLRRLYDANGISADLPTLVFEGQIIGHLDSDTVLNGLFTFEQINALLQDNGGGHMTNLYRLMP